MAMASMLTRWRRPFCVTQHQRLHRVMICSACIHLGSVVKRYHQLRQLRMLCWKQPQPERNKESGFTTRVANCSRKLGPVHVRERTLRCQIFSSIRPPAWSIWSHSRPSWPRLWTLSIDWHWVIQRLASGCRTMVMRWCEQRVMVTCNKLSLPFTVSNKHVRCRLFRPKITTLRCRVTSHCQN